MGDLMMEKEMKKQTKVLYINCCPREESRTERLAQELLKKLQEKRNSDNSYLEVEEMKLYEQNLQPLNLDRLNRRTKLIDMQDYSDPMFGYAKTFAAADIIIIAAPFWDLSFPSELKIYLENIYATGIVSKYGPDGMPVGLCKAEKLYYVTTAGGPYDPKYSYDYWKDLALNFFGMKETELIKAEMLDVYGFNPEEIMKKAMEEIVVE